MTVFAVSSWNIMSIKFIHLLFPHANLGSVNGAVLLEWRVFVYLFIYLICVRLCFLFDSPWKRRRSAAPLINDPHDITLVPVRKPRHVARPETDTQRHAVIVCVCVCVHQPRARAQEGQ